MSQSDRAEGRVRDLRADVLDRLRNHAPLTDGLEDTVDVGADVIVPAPFIEDADLDVGIAISVVTGSSSRENRQERKSMTVQADLQVRNGTLKSQGLAWHDTLLDEIAAVLTTQTEGWTAQGATGGTPEPLWDDDRNRYRSVQRFDVLNWG